MAISNNKISHLINSQVPFFVRSDHPNFVAFLEAYYEYLEQEEKVANRIHNIQTYNDIDLTIDDFTENLYDTFMKLVSKDILADRAMLLKNIKDFYRARGTEKSARFLMRILFDEEIDIYYPKKDVLRASDGKWYIQKSIRIRNTKINDVLSPSLIDLEKYISTQIVGSTSEATAIVESVERFYEGGTQIDELILSNIDGSFSSGELITALFDDVEDTKTITSNIFSGIINTINIDNAGALYEVGDPVIIVSSSGSGACATISSVSTGDISSINVLEGGAGYRVDDIVLVTGGGGSGANANIDFVLDNSEVHPNTYNIVNSTISVETNTPLSNAEYSNLNSGNANTTLVNTLHFWTFANTGPAARVLVIASGSGYTSTPTLSAVSNSAIRSLGIIGELEIVDPGQNYTIGDIIEIDNITGGLGTGALANVWNVDSAASDAISEVRLIEIPGHIIGGSGYDQNYLPSCNVNSSTGNGANIIVKNLLGYGAVMTAANTTLGAIERIVITNRGSGYTEEPSIDLTGSGDGTATANATIILGVATADGRYLNDDGHLSSYNFLQDRDYYQNWSYVLKTTHSIKEYREAVKELIHPSGTKVFGEFQKKDVISVLVGSAVETNATNKGITTNATYSYINTDNNLIVFNATHGLSNGNTVFLEFYSGNIHNVASNTVYDEANLTSYFSPNGIYSVANVVNTNMIEVMYDVTQNVANLIGETHDGLLYLGRNIV